MTPSTEPATILVVDDDPDSCDIAARLLEREGYRTRRAANGDECLRAVESEAIDLILLDVMMPGMDGFEVCAALRDGGRRIPVILLTARDDMDARLEGMNQGVSEFLTKPINRHELYARVRAQLHILALDRQLETVERNLRAARQDPPPGPRSGS
jgi:DNA-binding response OmpR family regulator